MTDYERIEQVLKYLGKNSRSLSTCLGLSSPQIFYDIKAGKCGISKKLALKIQEYFLEINPDWLLTGEGEMLKPGPTQIVSGPGAHHFTQTGDVAAPADGAAQSAATIDRLIDEMAAQRETFKSTVDQLLSVLNKFADKSRTDL